MASTTGGTLTSFIALSNSRNATARLLRIQPVTRRPFDCAAADCCVEREGYEAGVRDEGAACMGSPLGLAETTREGARTRREAASFFAAGPSGGEIVSMLTIE